MPSNQLLLILHSDDPSLDLGAGAADAPIDGEPLLEHGLREFCREQQVDVRAMRLQDVVERPEALDRARFAWVVTDAPPNALLNELGWLCHERHLPGLITRPAEAQEPGATLDNGLIVMPPDTDTSTLRRLFASLWRQSESIQSIKAEMALTQKQQNGLIAQIHHMDEELRLAAKLQREMTPHVMPDVAGFNLHSLYRPASHVSGDTYDVIPLDDDHVGLFIADATGHGVAAAMMTVYIKRSLQTHQSDPAGPDGRRVLGPDQALAALNRDMIRLESTHVRFCTAVYAILERSTRRLTVARAGHPFPLLLKPSGQTKPLEPEGPLLGVFDSAEFDTLELTLEPGDRLLMYSDGFEVAFDDAEGRRERLANEQYAREFQTLTEGSLQEALDALAARLDQQSGSLHQRDDLTVLILEARAEAGGAPLPQRQSARSENSADPPHRLAG